MEKKEYTLSLLLAAMLAGCGDNPRQAVNRTNPNGHPGNTDTLPYAVKADSLRHIELQRLSAIAYKDIRFGENGTTVRRKIGYFETIGRYKYAVGTQYMRGKRELYSISFATYPYKSASYYDTDVRDQWQNLVEVISAKYGSQIGRVFPSFFEMKAGRVIWTHTWYIGAKEIAVGVAEREAEYYALLGITDQRRYARLVAERSAKETESVNKSSESF